MKKVCFALLTIALLATITGFAGTIELRSDRSARAEIKEDRAKQFYTVRVHFIPVSTLDSVTNDEMTEILAEFFAEEALSNFFKEAKAVRFSGISPQVIQRDKNRVTIQYVIPLKNICKAEQSTEQSSADAMLKKFYASSQLSGNDLITDFRSTCFRDLRTAEIFFSSQIAESKDSVALEKKIRTAFAALNKKIDLDDALFMSEKEELLAKAQKVETFLLKRLQSGSSASSPQTSTTTTSGPNISRATFLPQFKEFLLYDDILLEVGGCRIFENASGKRALIAVGVAEVKNNSAKDRLMRRKIAEQKAFGELAKHQEVEVTFFAERHKTTEIKTENKVESGTSRRVSSSRITVQAEAYFEQMITVGYWYSKDGKLFFLAKGCFIK